MQENPLVSIIVITYNSSKYVLETLESAKVQTYPNIELIVSDDCSTDNTIEICKEWIDENKERFVRTELISVEKNTGIPANCNRGIKASQGEWLKLIAGDDALKAYAIQNVINVTKGSPSIEVLLTQVEVYKNNFCPNNLLSIHPSNWHIIPIYSNNPLPQDQLEFILNGGYHSTPGLFIKKKVYDEIGYYEEKYPLNEDTPYYLSLGLHKKMIYFKPIVTVNYRKSLNNLTSVLLKVIPVYMAQSNLSIYKASLKYGKLKFILNSFWNQVLILIILKLGNKGFLCIWLNKVRVTFQPLRFYNLMQRIFR